MPKIAEKLDFQTGTMVDVRKDPRLTAIRKSKKSNFW